MVEIEYKPVAKIVIHEVVKFDFESFVELKSQLAGTLVNWADGIMFHRGFVPPTEQVIKDQLDGVIHWALVEFAEMKEFKPEVIGKTTKNALRIVDASRNNEIVDFIKWLKKQPKWFPNDGV